MFSSVFKVLTKWKVSDKKSVFLYARSGVFIGLDTCRISGIICRRACGVLIDSNSYIRFVFVTVTIRRLTNTFSSEFRADKQSWLLQAVGNNGEKCLSRRRTKEGLAWSNQCEQNGSREALHCLYNFFCLLSVKGEVFDFDERTFTWSRLSKWSALPPHEFQLEAFSVAIKQRRSVSLRRLAMTIAVTHPGYEYISDREFHALFGFYLVGTFCGIRHAWPWLTLRWLTGEALMNSWWATFGKKREAPRETQMRRYSSMVWYHMVQVRGFTKGLYVEGMNHDGRSFSLEAHKTLLFQTVGLLYRLPVKRSLTKSPYIWL